MESMRGTRGVIEFGKRCGTSWGASDKLLGRELILYFDGETTAQGGLIELM